MWCRWLYRLPRFQHDLRFCRTPFSTLNDMKICTSYWILIDYLRLSLARTCLQTLWRHTPFLWVVSSDQEAPDPGVQSFINPRSKHLLIWYAEYIALSHPVYENEYFSWFDVLRRLFCSNLVSHLYLSMFTFKWIPFLIWIRSTR